MPMYILLGNVRKLLEVADERLSKKWEWVIVLDDMIFVHFIHGWYFRLKNCHRKSA